jgi:hypothetical protein
VFAPVLPIGAYAQTFGIDDSASYLARVQEIPVEAHSIAVDIGNSTLVQWHLGKLHQYWTANDTSQIAGKDQILANEITLTISNITTETVKPNPDQDVINQLVANLDSYLTKSIPVRLDQTQLQNNTINALAIANVLNETFSDYSNATGLAAAAATGSNISMSNISSSSSSLTTHLSNSSSITNFAAYQSAEALAKVASGLWDKLKARTPNGPSNTLHNLDSGFAQLIQAIDGKQPNNQLMMILHENIQPGLVSLYNLQTAGQSSPSTTGTVTSILMKKRIDYLSETSMQRHDEHLAQNDQVLAPYKANLNYTLNANGTAIPVGGSSSSPNTSTQLQLSMSVFRSTATIVTIDIMNGTVTTGNGDMKTIQAGFAYYLINMHKFVVFGYIPQKEAGNITSVQLLELWCTSDNSTMLPSASTNTPLPVKIWSPESRVGNDWEIQASGQITLS